MGGNVEDESAVSQSFLCQDTTCILFSLAVAVAVVLLWKIWQAITRNPFLVTLPLPISHAVDYKDRAEREKLLKIGYRPDRVPSNVDAIVIGSGMGGLTCAGLMARAGKKVLVLEQHDRAGGSTHVFEEKGFEFDVGVHYVGGMSVGSMNRTLVDVLTDGKLVWDEMDREFDTVVLRQQGKVVKSFSYLAGHQEYEKQLLMYFPEEHKAISEFLKLLNRCEKVVVGYSIMKQLPKLLLRILIRTGIHNFLFSSYNEMVGKSTKEVLDGLTDNKELKFVLGYAFGDYGTFPSEAPFLMHAILMKHFYDGAYYPRGGPSELAMCMIPGILRAGGAVLVRAPVNRIIIDGGGTASGVSISRSGIDFEVRAPIVISSAGILNTYQSLLPKEIAQKYGLEDLCKKVDKGLACFQTFIGFEGTAEELDLKKRNFWVYGSVDAESSIREFLSLSREDAANADIPIAFISFPSAKDSTWKSRHPGTSVCVVVTFLNWDWFQEWDGERIMKRGAVYKDLKKVFQEQIWKLVCSQFPNLQDKMKYIDSGSPLSHKYYLGCPRGDIYGIDHTVKRFQEELGIELRPETPIPGLYLTGQDIFTCGVMGATVSGLLTSGTCLGRNHFTDLFAAMGWRRILNFSRKMKHI